MDVNVAMKDANVALHRNDSNAKELNDVTQLMVHRLLRTDRKHWPLFRSNATKFMVDVE